MGDWKQSLDLDFIFFVSTIQIRAKPGYNTLSDRLRTKKFCCSCGYPGRYDRLL